MKSPHTYVILLLATTTIGGALLAWNQYAELVELRAAAMNRDERSDLQKRISDLERMNRELDDRLAAMRTKGESEPTEAVASAEGEDNRGQPERGRFGKGERGRGGPPGGGREFTAMREIMSKPEVQALLSVQQKAAVEARYAALFKSLNLSPEQLEKFKTALADRQTTFQDIMGAARDQGMDPRTDPEGYRKLMASAQTDFTNNLKSVLGEAGYAQYQNFEQTLPQRNVVNQLQQRLSYSDSPLSQAQSDQMVQILAANAAASRRTVTTATGTTPPTYSADAVPGGPPGGGMRMGLDFGAMFAGGGGGAGGPTSAITPNAVAQAQTVLTAPQLAALQQLQQQQQAAQQLQQIMRDTISNAQKGAKTETPTTPNKPRG